MPSIAETEKKIKGVHLATMTVYETENGVQAFMQIADEEGKWIDIPPHMASQLPMAIKMMQSQIGG